MSRLRCLLVAACLLRAAVAAADDTVRYRLSFPQPEHHWMQVEVLLDAVPPGPLRLRMSRSSPGRYALHEFAKNVFDLSVTDTAGRVLGTVNPTPSEWVVAAPAAPLTVRYRVFGDLVDGTYLAVDASHAHVNMPAALMWVEGFDARPAEVTVDLPPAAAWRVATQLLPGPAPLTFTAPNLQYLMDSPMEIGPVVERFFAVPDGGRQARFRVAVHHQGTDAEIDAYVGDLEKIAREARRVFGRFPAFEGGQYTFLVDALPWARGDGMEHRNSTVLTFSRALGEGHAEVIDAAAHELFHAWNVERIRPRSLEPFRFDDVNVSSELWLAEGVTNYYGPLLLTRAGLLPVSGLAATFARAINDVTLSPGRRLRTVEEMSRLAPLVDAATAIDPTNLQHTYLSYYTWGEAIGLALDLALRERGATLDAFMRALWDRFGTSAEGAFGLVPRTYTADDVRGVLARVAGDEPFARDFFARYIQGHDVADCRTLLEQAGLVVRPARPAAAVLSGVRVDDTGASARIVALVTPGTQAYEGGLERDDVITGVGGVAVSNAEQLEAALGRQSPGAVATVTFLRRGAPRTARIRLDPDPRVEVVPIEAAGGRLTEPQRRFRAAWLGREN